MTAIARPRIGDAAARAGVGAVLGRVRSGRIDVVEGARERSYGPPDAELRATLTINDAAAWRGPLRGSVGLGEGYVDGLWETDDLDPPLADPAEDGSDAGAGERVPHRGTNPRRRSPSGCGW